MATAHWFGNPPDSLEPVLSQDEHSGLLVDPTQEVPPEPKTPEMRRQFYYFPPDSSDMENGVAAGEMIESPDLTPWSILLMVPRRVAITRCLALGLGLSLTHKSVTHALPGFLPMLPRQSVQRREEARVQAHDEDHVSGDFGGDFGRASTRASARVRAPCATHSLLTPMVNCIAVLRYATMMRVGVCVSQVILFIVAISLHGIDNPKNNWMIGPNSSTLIRMGAKNPYMMRYKAHIERFFSPIFLHSGIIHILVNLTIQLRMGLYLERRWGSIKFTCTYVGSGMVGIMMGCVLQPGTISVAASACVMGLIGAYLAQLTITWHKFDPFQLKVALFQCIFVLVVTTLEGTLLRHSLSKPSTLTRSLPHSLSPSWLPQESARTLSTGAATWAVLWLVSGSATFSLAKSTRCGSTLSYGACCPCCRPLRCCVSMPLALYYSTRSSQYPSRPCHSQRDMDGARRLPVVLAGLVDCFELRVCR